MLANCNWYNVVLHINVNYVAVGGTYCTYWEKLVKIFSVFRVLQRFFWQILHEFWLATKQCALPVHHLMPRMFFEFVFFFSETEQSTCMNFPHYGITSNNGDDASILSTPTGQETSMKGSSIKRSQPSDTDCELLASDVFSEPLSITCFLNIWQLSLVCFYVSGGTELSCKNFMIWFVQSKK